MRTVAVVAAVAAVGDEPPSSPPHAAETSAPQRSSHFIYTDPVLPVILLLIALGQASPPPPPLAVGCSVVGDQDARVFELRRAPDPRGNDWVLLMKSRKAGSAPVILPLPDARPELSRTHVTLSNETLNGGRHIEWRVTPAGASLDVHVNFELEVNIEADLDPRVELMNTEGALTRLTCEIAPS